MRRFFLLTVVLCLLIATPVQAVTQTEPASYSDRVAELVTALIGHWAALLATGESSAQADPDDPETVSLWDLGDTTASESPPEGGEIGPRMDPNG